MKQLSQLFSTIFLGFMVFANASNAQTQRTWPHAITEQERDYVERIGFEPSVARGIETPPPYDNIRTAAEWEEVEALTISWTSFPCIQKQIVEAAKEECTVIIFAEDMEEVTDYLTGNQCGGALTLENIQIVPTVYNSIWIRDYGANTVYGSWNDDRVLVDWLYNRPRPEDDAIPDVLASTLGLELYSTTGTPNDLMNTGGNWMSDGFGTAFASELIIDENDGGSTWWTDYPDHSEEEINQIISDFHGVDTYITMPNLPFDGIHHIDMHMKLLDESTLLMAEYPEGTADGPQINANLEYVLSNFTTRWGTPFEVVRIPSPPEQGFGGGYPDENGWYLTYTNSVFVNNTILLPTYYTEYDTTALRIYEEALPGYNVVGIDCDNNGEAIISLSGAIHCITHTVGIEDPLMISHLPLPDTDDTVSDYDVEAYISHRSQIESATMHWRTNPGSEWTAVPMALIDGETENWSASIPAQPLETTVYYYVEANANSGKTGTRPMPAPDGWWSFNVNDASLGMNEIEQNSPLLQAFPNPAAAITCIPLQLRQAAEGQLYLSNALGQQIQMIHSGDFRRGEQKYFFDAQGMAAGAYLLTLDLDTGERWSQHLMIR
ncbi:agmatine deiminase family protein [Flavobacteriales bacterium]|nr:agmatine deiminase family protein [Flavobacteriales bacterium]